MSISLKELYLDLDPNGNVIYNPEPKKSNSIWTHRRKNELNKPMPYKRNRRLENGKTLEIYGAFKKDSPSYQLMSKVKDFDGKDIRKVIQWAIADLVYVLRDKNITMVAPMPSSHKMSNKFAQMIAKKLGAEFSPVLSKEIDKSITKVPINVRKSVAAGLFSVSQKVKRQNILIIDDYSTTGASLMGAATKLYQNGASNVIGAVFAI